MNAFFEPILEIKGLTAEGPNRVTCLLPISAEKDIPKNEFREIKDFLQRLFQLVLLHQGKQELIAAFSIIDKIEEISFDDLQKSIISGEVNLTCISPLKKESVAISLEGENVQWCDKAIVERAISYSFISHLQCLIFLGEVIEKVKNDGVVIEDLKELISDLTYSCGQDVNRYNQACADVVSKQEGGLLNGLIISTRNQYLG